MIAKKQWIHYNNLIGSTINYLEIRGIKHIAKGLGKYKRIYLECKCLMCSRIIDIRATSVINETTKSCGCERRSLLAESHTLPNNQAIFNSIYTAYKLRSNRKKIAFSLTKEEFIKIISLPCIYCGRMPSYRILKRTNRKNKTITRNEIDRFNNNIGYILSNCVSCCHQCNRAKSNFTPKEFIDWIKSIYKNIDLITSTSLPVKE